MENKLKQEEYGISVKLWGQSNQVHQLKLLLKITLMKNSQFCEDMSKSKNVIRVTLIVYF